MMPQGGAPQVAQQAGPQGPTYQGGANPNQMPSGPNSKEEDDSKNPTAVLGELQKALFQTNQAVQGSQLPKPAQDALKMALQNYNTFIGIVGKSMGVPMPGQDQMSMGMQDS